ncbi:hypothetical protein HK405_009291, partial [Cladochytrium tenue]
VAASASRLLRQELELLTRRPAAAARPGASASTSAAAAAAAQLKPTPPAAPTWTMAAAVRGEVPATELLRTAAVFVVAPFLQGMFYGLGEGAARILLKRYWGIEAIGGVAPVPRIQASSAVSPPPAAAKAEGVADGSDEEGAGARSRWWWLWPPSW